MAYDPFDQQQPQVSPEDDYIAKRRKLTAQAQAPREDILRAMKALGMSDESQSEMGRGMYSKESATELPQEYENILGRLPTHAFMVPTEALPGRDALQYIEKEELPGAREAAVQLAQLMQGKGEAGLQKRLATQDLPNLEAKAKFYGSESDKLSKRPILSEGQKAAEEQGRNDVGSMAIQSAQELAKAKSLVGGERNTPDQNIAEMEAAAKAQEEGAAKKQEAQSKESARALALKNSVDDSDLEGQLIHDIKNRKSLERTPGVLDWLAVVMGGLGKGNPLDMVEKLTGRKEEEAAKARDTQELIHLLGMRNQRKLIEAKIGAQGKAKALTDPQIRLGFQRALGPHVMNELGQAERVLSGPDIQYTPQEKQKAQQVKDIVEEALNQASEHYGQTGQIPIMYTEKELPALSKLRGVK